MFCVATLQPNQGTLLTRFLTRDEMVRQIDAFYTMSQCIPLCIDHCGAQTCGFEVPANERIGRVSDLWINHSGQLMVKLWLDGAHPHFKRINQGIFHSGERWGVSVWIDQLFDVKMLTHVALTTNPFFARQGTWMHGWNVLEGPMDRQIAQAHYDTRHEQCYGHPAFLAKLEGSRQTVSHCADPVAAQRPAVTTGNSAMDVETPNQQQPATQGTGFSQPPPVVEQKAMQTRQEQEDEANGVEPEQYKRQRLADGTQGQQRQQPTAAPQGQGTRPPQQTDVELDNPASVKRAIRQYEAYMQDAGILPSKLDPKMKLFYSQLVTRADEQDQQFLKHYNRMFEAQGLKPPDLSLVPQEAQESVFTFVAASDAYTERNEAELKRLQERMASMERQQTFHSIKTTSAQYRGPETQTPLLPSVDQQAQSKVATTAATVDLFPRSGEVRTRPVQSTYFSTVFDGSTQSTKTTVDASHADSFNDFMHLFRGKTAGI